MQSDVLDFSRRLDSAICQASEFRLEPFEKVSCKLGRKRGYRTQDESRQ